MVWAFGCFSVIIANQSGYWYLGLRFLLTGLGPKYINYILYIGTSHLKIVISDQSIRDDSSSAVPTLRASSSGLI